MATAEESNHSAKGMLHPHHNATFFLYGKIYIHWGKGQCFDAVVEGYLIIIESETANETSVQHYQI